MAAPKSPATPVAAPYEDPPEPPRKVEYTSASRVELGNEDRGAVFIRGLVGAGGDGKI